MIAKDIRLLVVLAVIALYICSSWATLRAEDTAQSRTSETNKGYSCVMMGHSFFYPIAAGFPEIADACGFTQHKQVLRKAGATKGTPGWLWDNLPHDEEIWTTLASKDVDLICFPHHHLGGCGLEDYCKWIDYARKRNTHIMVAIAIPWGPLYDRPADEFGSFYRDNFEIPVHKLVDALRTKYPENAIFVIPHGRGVADLYAKYKAGEVPEIKQVGKQNAQDTVESFFADQGAHIGRMPLVLSQLIWLETIYQVDVRTCKWDTGYQMDLKQLAHDIVANDPYAKIASEKLPHRAAEEASRKSSTEAAGQKAAP